MARGKLPKPTKDKEGQKDAETFKGIIRNQKKQIEQLKRENSRLNKLIDTRNELRDDYMDGLETPGIEDEFSGWRCQKCKHNKNDEFTLPKGAFIVVTFRTCKKCGHKERHEHEREGNGS